MRQSSIDGGRRRISVLGATGSIGTSTLDLLRAHEGAFCVEALSAHRDVEGLARAARETGARLAVVADPACYDALRQALSGSGVEAAAGPRAVIEAAERPADIVVAGIVGAAGLESALAAVRRGTTLALANKECLVCAGDLFMAEARASGARVLPVDSEHNAVFQILDGTARAEVERVVLTASGGPFRDWSAERMAKARPRDALRHPNWSMGAKISVDSASLVNKGLELIEAQHLFALRPDDLDVLVHPQSLVHALVHFRDGSVLAQLAAPDMRTPIAHCLAWPKRMATDVARLDLAALSGLTFERADLTRFPGLGLALEAMRAGGAMPTLFNAANEVAVEAFLAERIGFRRIAGVIETVMETAAGRSGLSAPASVEDALQLDAFGRTMALEALAPEGRRKGEDEGASVFPGSSR